MTETQEPAAPPLAPAAILYHPEGYDTRRPKLMGRHAAGEGFLRAYFTAAAAAGERPVCFAGDRGAFTAFETGRRAIAPSGPQSAWIAPPGGDGLRQTGCLYRPDPLLSGDAFTRRRWGQRSYSLTGVTHTVSSASAMDGLCDLLTAPLQDWDAVICTSEAVRTAITNVVGGYGAYLRTSLGAEPRLRCQLPVIPLGVSLQSFPKRETMAGARAARRRQLGVADDAVIALFIGRLSFHAKAHPGVMFQALEAAAKRRPAGGVHLVLAGWFANDAIEQAFREAASVLMPSVGLSVVDGREAQIRHDIWYAADLFISLADNVQETFGLTPIEGMAAGLPCIVTDWNGYRETVRHGIDGFRVPTAAPAPGLEQALSTSFDTGVFDYDRFIGEASLHIAVDTRAAADACSALIDDPDRRQTMGAAGRRRAEEVFDWSRVMTLYRDLWRDLARRRRHADEHAPPMAGTFNPRRPDTFTMFGHYPSLQISGATLLAAGTGVKPGDIDDVSRLAINAFGRFPRLDSEQTQAIVARLAAGPISLSDLSTALSAPPDRLLRTVTFLAKIGAVQLISPQGSA